MSEERAVRIMNAIGGDFHGPSSDLIWRIETLLGAEDEVYVDARLMSFDGTHGGVAVVLTPTRVIHAKWSAPAQRDGRQSTARVETWARKGLLTASIDAGQEGDGVNADGDWARDWGEDWPYGGVLSLWYEGREQPLKLPLDSRTSRRKHFRTLLPALLADLSQ
ncbi:hypothetical protein GCM10022267_49960 [Lentzea roselyniae]|uniref:Immunity protein Imm1 n=1 Tax=Lentzea roselyniae TaxID=531940 RepID=A0ABP7BFG9_9PSEU